jgi:hypothetical protein
MDNSTAINIVDLSDEILLNISNKLNNIYVLYSLIGVNKKHDQLARAVVFTRSLDFVTTLSNGENDQMNSVLDRFCINILPQIVNNIECLTRGATGIYFFEIYFPTGIIYLLRIYYLYQDFLAPSAAPLPPIFALTRTRVGALTLSLDDIWDLFQNVQGFFNKSR